MNLVFASDSFKGSLSSQTIAQILTEEAALAFPGCGTASVPVADGGEGTLDAVQSALSGTRRRVNISGPLFAPAQGEYLLLEHHTALIELAQAAGLTMVPPSRRDPACSRRLPDCWKLSVQAPVSPSSFHIDRAVSGQPDRAASRP